MMRETTEFASSKQYLELPKIPNLPKNIASFPKPDNQDIINNQISRFEWKCYVFLLIHFLFPKNDRKSSTISTMFISLSPSLYNTQFPCNSGCIFQITHNPLDSAKSRVWRVCVLACSRAYVLMRFGYFRAFCAFVLTCLTYLCAYVLDVLTCSSNWRAIC